MTCPLSTSCSTALSNPRSTSIIAVPPLASPCSKTSRGSHPSFTLARWRVASYGVGMARPAALLPEAEPRPALLSPHTPRDPRRSGRL